MTEKRVELLVYQLCQEIDFLKKELEQIEDDRDYWRQQAINSNEQALRHNEKIMGTILTGLVNGSLK